MQERQAEGPTYELSSADGSWNIRLEPEVLSLQTSGSGFEEMVSPLRHLLDRLLADRTGLSFERVALAYFSAAPVGGQAIEELFTESVMALITDWDVAFTQALSGTWHRGYYTLHYGLEPYEETILYLSDAWVSASDVQALDLDAVLWDLNEEGLRLLSWPITPQAVESLEVAEGLIEHLASKTDVQQPFLSFGVSAFDQVNQERFRLLAKKYGRRGFSAEDEMHLEVLNDRVRLLLPRVPRGHWQLLEEINSRLDEVQERNQKIRQKYRLSADRRA